MLLMSSAWPAIGTFSGPWQVLQVMPDSAEIGVAAEDRRLVRAHVHALQRRSPAGWQFTQRGCRITFPASSKSATERALSSAMQSNSEAGLSGVGLLLRARRGGNGKRPPRSRTPAASIQRPSATS